MLLVFLRKVGALPALGLMAGLCAASPVLHADPALEIPLATSAGGAYELPLSVAGQESSDAAFLLDTGAAMVTINRTLFDRWSDTAETRQLREVAAKMADGRYRRFPVYEMKGLRVVGGCDLGPIEVLVVSAGGRNLLGLNALQRFAPFTLSMDPPALLVSGCGAPDTTHSVAAAPSR